MTSRLGTGKPLTFFYSVPTYIIREEMHLQVWKNTYINQRGTHTNQSGNAYTNPRRNAHTSQRNKCPHQDSARKEHTVVDCSFSLKGQCHEIFCFRFFSWIIFRAIMRGLGVTDPCRKTEVENLVALSLKRNWTLHHGRTKSRRPSFLRFRMRVW